MKQLITFYQKLIKDFLFYLPKIRKNLILIGWFFLSLMITPVFGQVSLNLSLNPLELTNQAQQLYQQNNFNEAINFWQQAEESFANQNDQLNRAIALSNLSLTYQQLGEWNQAQESIKESLTILNNLEKTTEQQRVYAQTLEIQAKLYREIGDSQEALNIWQQTTEIYQEISDINLSKQSQINQAQVLQDLGLYPLACNSLLEVLEINLLEIGQKLSLELQDCKSLSQLNQIERDNFNPYLSKLIEEKPNTEIKFNSLLGLGEIFQIMGNLELSELILRENLTIAESLNLDKTRVYLTLANTLRLKKNPELALENYQKASESSNLITKIQAQLNQLSLYIETEQWEKINNLPHEIKSQLNQLSLNKQTIYAHLNLTQSLICWQKSSDFTTDNQANLSPIMQQCGLNNNSISKPSSFSWQEIDHNLVKLLAEVEQKSPNNKQALSYLKGYLGAVKQEENNLNSARQLTIEALNLVSNNTEIAYRWQWQLGKIYQLENQPEKSLKYYQEAYQNLQNLRQDLVAIHPDVQFNFRDSVEPLYREYVELLLSNNPNQEQLKQARNVIEDLQLAELNNFFSDACTEYKSENIDNFDSETAVIYAILLKDKVEVILSLYHPNSFNDQKQLELYHYSSEQIENPENLLIELNNRLRKKFFNEQIQELSQQVYNWLLKKPIEEQLSKHSEVKNLVFVLDGVLRNIPMAVLYDNINQEYLIEKYALAVTPGLQLIKSDSLPREKLAVLTAGISEARNIEGKNFSPLKYVEVELEEIKQVMSQYQYQQLLNQNFTKETFSQQINSSQFPIVHIASHGSFSSNPEKTYILTYNELLNSKEFNDLLKISTQQPENIIDLLILSACETAKNDNRAILGLAGIAVRAGARSTLATLWQVDDQLTSELMNTFYHQLQNSNISKAEALRQAQLSLLQKTNEPFNWASYILIGNWL